MADNSLCDGCGTVLPLPGAAGAVVCPSCARVAQDERTEPTPPPESPGEPFATWTPEPSFQVRTTTFTTTDSGTDRAINWGARLGCSLVLFLVFGGGAGIFALVRSGLDGSGPLAGLRSSSLYPLSGSTVVLPGEGKTTDLIVMASDNSDDSRRKLVRVSLPDGGERWKSEALPKDLYSAELAIDGDDLWVGGADHLYLLSLATGETRWETVLTDKLTTRCGSCFTVLDGQLVLRTDDAYVTAFSAQSREPRWSRRLQSPAGSLSRAGDGIYVVDDPPVGTTTEVIRLDPATGKTIRTYRPTCAEREADPYIPFTVEMSGDDPIRAIPETGDLVTWFGFGYGCVTRFDPTSGKVKWATPLPNGNFGDDAALNKGNLVFTGSSGPLVRIDLADGRASELEAIPDAQAVPHAIVGRTLVGQTSSTRGSTKGGLAAWDLRTGQRLWSVRLPGSAQPVSKGSSDALFDGTVRTVLAVDGAKVRLVSMAGDDRSIRVQDVDVADGELSTARTEELRSRYESSGTPSVTVESTARGRLVIGVDSIVQVVDLASGRTLASWPAKD